MLSFIVLLFVLFCRAYASSEKEDVTEEAEEDVSEEAEDVIEEEEDVDEEPGWNMFDDMKEPRDLRVASAEKETSSEEADSNWSNDMIASLGSRITGFPPQEMTTQQFYPFVSTQNLLGKTSVSEFVSPQHQTATGSQASLFSDNFSIDTPSIPELERQAGNCGDWFLDLLRDGHQIDSTVLTSSSSAKMGSPTQLASVPQYILVNSTVTAPVPGCSWSELQSATGPQDSTSPHVREQEELLRKQPDFLESIQQMLPGSLTNWQDCLFPSALSQSDLGTSESIVPCVTESHISYNPSYPCL